MSKLTCWCVAGAFVASCSNVTFAATEQTNSTDWAKINSLTWQSTGLTTKFPPMQDTLFGDAGGWRSDLAKHNIGIEPRISISAITDFNQNKHAPKDSYLGQGTDVQGGTYSLGITYGLEDLGLPNSKIVACLQSTNSTVASNPPNNRSIGCFSYYQSFFNGKLEFKAGFEPNLYTYVGMFTGGDATLTNTVGSIIPVQAGLSDPMVTPPTVNFTLHGDDGLYVRAGAQRSVSPQGRVYEVENNGFGLNASMDDAKVMYVGEAGIDRSSSANEKRVWVRAGTIQNPTQYKAFLGGEDSNKAYWALADYQLTQPNKSMPMHGLYVGASAMYAPPEVNLYTQNYELRTYYYGPFKSRPLDKVTFAIGNNVFSKDAQDALKARHLEGASKQWSATASYAMHVTRGIYLSTAVGYTQHPSFAAGIDDATTFKMGLLFSF